MSKTDKVINIIFAIGVGFLIAFFFFSDWDWTLFAAFIACFMFGGWISQIYIRKIHKEAEEYGEEQKKIRQEKYLKSPEYKEKLLLEELVAKRVLLLERLTDISGVTDKVARTLLDQFPTEESIKDASVEDLSDIPGIGGSVARAIKARLG